MSALLLLVAVSGSGVPPLRAAPDWSQLSASADREVRGDILEFWLAHARNPANQGFVGLVDAQLHAHPHAPRGELLTARVLWTFSRAYEQYHDPRYLNMARWAFRDLTENFIDPVHGGFYWSITSDGRPLDTAKLIYGEAFAIYAFAEYHAATGDRAALRQASALFHLVDEKAHDNVNGGYFDSYDRAWRRTGQNPLGPAPKTQNSTIHILEAFTRLMQVWPDPAVRARDRELVGILLDHVIDPRTHHLILYLTDDWRPLSDQISYGHDIELSWLITEAAQALGDPALIARTRKTAVQIATVTLAQGVNALGGVVNLADPQGWINRNCDWWNQAEATTGFLNAYQISRDPKFAAAALRSWHFIQAYQIDHRHGEWFESIQPDGTPVPSDPKISMWKCPYHHSRCCFQVMERCRELESGPQRGP